MRQNQKIVTHEIDMWPSRFNELASGIRRFDLIENNRDFQVKDVIIVTERFRNPGDRSDRTTGKKLAFHINYVGTDFIGLEPGFVLLGFRAVKPGKSIP